MKVSKNFNSRELCITNATKVEHVINITRIVHELLQPLRDYLNEPISVTSGIRTKEQNKKVLGVENSQHLTGNAVDFTCNSLQKAFEFLYNKKEFDQLIYYKKSGFIHVSLKENKNRQQVIILH